MINATTSEIYLLVLRMRLAGFFSMPYIVDIQAGAYLLEKSQHKQEDNPIPVKEAFFHFHRKETKIMQQQFINCLMRVNAAF